MEIPDFLHFPHLCRRLVCFVYFVVRLLTTKYTKDTKRSIPLLAHGVRLAIACLVFVFGVSTKAQTPSSPPAESISAKVDQLFAPWDKPNSPGCSIAIAKEGQVVYKRGYGTGNLELGVPLTASSVFNVGSISKAFTAMSILMLAQQGKLSLDDPVRKYVPEVPDFGTPITLRHLIHHTSGIRDFLEMLEMAGWRVGDITTEKDILDMVARQRTLNHKPGDEYVYSNTGYVLLAVIVKRVTGKPLSVFTEDNIFKPLGMNDTRFSEDHTEIIPRRVNGYLPKQGGGFRKWMPSADYIGSSNVLTTVEDLVRWDENFHHHKVGGPALIEQMLARGALNDATKLDYAHGLLVFPYKGQPTIYHGGSTLGYQGALLRFPDQRFSVTVLCNARGNNPEGLAKRIADLYLADKLVTPPQIAPATAPPNAIKLPESELSNVAGYYWNPLTDVVRRVYVKEGKLMYFRSASNESELAPVGDKRFVMLGVRSRVELEFRGAGHPLRMFLTENDGKPSVWEPVKQVVFTPSKLAEFAGEYFSPEVNATYTISPQGDKLLFRTGNWGDFVLSARFADSFANPEEMGSLIFTRDKKDRVNGFVIRSGKVKNLRFQKVK